MNFQNPDFIIKAMTIIFMIIWGTYERASAIFKGRKHSHTADNDQRSLLLLFGAIFVGYFAGIPVSFLAQGSIALSFPYLALSGLVITVAGLSIRLIAIRTLARQFTYTVKIVDSHELIVSGIYKYIRHPSYLGQALIFLGCGLALSNWISIVLLFVPTALATVYRINVEEKVLVEHFSTQYQEYMRKTKKLIPWVY